MVLIFVSGFFFSLQISGWAHALPDMVISHLFSKVSVFYLIWIKAEAFPWLTCGNTVLVMNLQVCLVSLYSALFRLSYGTGSSSGYCTSRCQETSKFREGQQGWSGVWKPSSMRKDWKNWACLALKRQTGDITLFKYLKGCHAEEGQDLFLIIPESRTCNKGLKLQEVRFQLNIRKKLPNC